MAKMAMMVLCVVVACMVVAAPYAEAAITCGQVVSKIAPCLTYLKKGGVVPPRCCNGVRALNDVAKSTSDRQTACKCLKEAYASHSGVSTSNVAGLPSKCGISIPYKISTNTDCSKVQ